MMQKQLQKMLETRKIPHALIFTNGTKKEREESVQMFANQALKNSKEFHPDIHHYRIEGKLGMHTIESLRKLTDEVSMLPVCSTMQFFIIHEASNMLPISSNALLKTLEEPISHSIIILLTDSKEKLLPTIISRCQTITFPSVSKVFSKEQRGLLDLLTNSPTFEQIEEFAKEKEEMKKDLEKKLLKQMPKDLTPIQREHYEKELEGSLSFRFKEEAREIFELFYLLAHDETLEEVGLPRRLEKSVKLKMTEVEEALKMALLSLERSISFSTILPALCIQLKII